MTIKVLWVTPQPVQFPMYTDALASVIGTDTTIVYHRTIGTSFDELVAAASHVAADVVLLAAAPGINPEDFARSANVVVLRPQRETVKNSRGVSESRFVGFAPVVTS